MSMMRPTADGQLFGALLALTLKEHSCLSRGKDETEALLDRLGFCRFSHVMLQQYTARLVGFIFAHKRTGFISRDAYVGAGLSLANVYSEMISLKVCDVRFLVQHVRKEHFTATEDSAV